MIYSFIEFILYCEKRSTRHYSKLPSKYNDETNRIEIINITILLPCIGSKTLSGWQKYTPFLSCYQTKACLYYLCSLALSKPEKWFASIEKSFCQWATYDAFKRSMRGFEAPTSMELRWSQTNCLFLSGIASSKAQKRALTETKHSTYCCAFLKITPSILPKPNSLPKYFTPTFTSRQEKSAWIFWNRIGVPLGVSK